MSRPRLVVGDRLWVGLAVIGPLIPLVVAVLARRNPAWVPDLDLALTELRVRDVGSPDSPLVGLPGRIGTLERQGSHPGPISFYLLAPLYRLLGGTTFALQVATVALHATAVVALVLVVARQAGVRWAMAVSLVTTLLVSALGPNLFTEPWNPHLPVLWWPVFLAAAWGALSGDRVALPVLAVSGAICAQTHLSYLGAVGVVTLAVVAVVAARSRSGRVDAATWPWLAATVLLVGLLWLPPLVDQVRHDPGNGTLLAEHLFDPPEEAIGWSTGARLVLERFDLVHFLDSALLDPGRLADSYPTTASASRGGAVVLGLVAVGLLTRRWRAPRPQRWAWAVSGAALSLALVSVARIFGTPWGYLLLFVWPVALLASLTAASAATARVRSRATPAAATVAVTILLFGVAARAGVAATGAESSNPVVSRTVRALVPPVLDGLDPDRRYLVTWTDAIHLGGHGYGMVLELERRGLDLVVPSALGTQFGQHRAASSGGADAQLVVATGTGIARWTSRGDVELLAEVDVRTPSERAEAVRTRRALVEVLRASGREELVEVIDENLLVLAFDPTLPVAARPLVHRLDALGAPAAVLLAPVGAGAEGPG